MRAIEQRCRDAVIDKAQDLPQPRQTGDDGKPAPTRQTRPNRPKRRETRQDLIPLPHMQCACGLIRRQSPSLRPVQGIKGQRRTRRRGAVAVMINLKPAQGAGVVIQDAGFFGHAAKIARRSRLPTLPVFPVVQISHGGSAIGFAIGSRTDGRRGCETPRS